MIDVTFATTCRHYIAQRTEHLTARRKMETIKIFYKRDPAVNLRKVHDEDGVVLDVRTSAEFLGGHIPGALNIELDQLSSHVRLLPNKGQYIVTCCASGERSACAKVILESLGYTRVFNGGSWKSLQEHMIHVESEV